MSPVENSNKQKISTSLVIKKNEKKIKQDVVFIKLAKVFFFLL